MKVLVCGSRSLESDQHGTRVHFILTGAADGHDQFEIIHGDAPLGADHWAADWAKENGVPCTAFPADWEMYGRKAGVLRNLRMLNERPDKVIAFWDGTSKGTKHTIDEARRRGIPVEVVSP
jgi:hypothetical protein